MNVVIGLEDPMLGSWHQITVEGEEIRLDGTTVPPDFETYKMLVRFLRAFDEDFGGVTGKDVYLAEILAQREADERFRVANNVSEEDKMMTDPEANK